MLPLLASLLLPWTPAQGSDFAWHRYDDQVQYGILESDDRMVSLGCASPGRIWLTVPTNGSPKMVWINGQPYAAELVVRGDGNNLEVVLDIDAEPISRLADDEGITVRIQDVGWNMPGGAGGLMQELIERCA